MPAGITYETVATTTLTTTTASVTFSTISGSYTDLILVFADVKLSGATDSAINFQVGNGSVDTGSNYSFTIMGARSTSGTPFSNRLDTTTQGRSNWYTSITSSVAAMSQMHFMDYSNTTTFKSILANSRVQPGDANYSGTETIVNLWRSTSAINTIKVYPNVGSFTSGSTFTLYGITAA
jgi:hypothetical protein